LVPFLQEFLGIPIFGFNRVGVRNSKRKECLGIPKETLMSSGRKPLDFLRKPLHHLVGASDELKKKTI